MRTKLSKTPVVMGQVLEPQVIGRISKTVNCVIEPERYHSGKPFTPGDRIAVKEAIAGAFIFVETVIESEGTEYETSGLPWPGAELI